MILETLLCGFLLAEVVRRYLYLFQKQPATLFKKEQLLLSYQGKLWEIKINLVTNDLTYSSNFFGPILLRIFAAVKAYLVNDYISDFTNRNIIVEKPIFIVSRGSTFSKCSSCASNKKDKQTQSCRGIKYISTD